MLDIVPQRYADDIARCEAPIDEMRGASLDHQVEIAVPNGPWNTDMDTDQLAER